MVKNIELKKTLVLFNQVSINTVLFTGLWYFLTQLFRALRFKVLTTEKELKIIDVMIINFIYSFFNRVLPARLGEISYVVFANKFGAISKTDASGALIVSRIYDLITASIIFLMAVILYPSGLNSHYIFFVFFILLLFVFVLFHLPKLPQATKYLITPLNKMSQSWHEKCLNLLDMLALYFKCINSKKIVTLALFYSFMSWITLYIMFYYVLLGFNIELSFYLVVIGSIFATMTNLLPVSGFGGFGTMEAGWTIGFMFIGIDKTTAFTTGFGVNVLTFLFTCLFSFLSWIAIYKIQKCTKK